MTIDPIREAFEKLEWAYDNINSGREHFENALVAAVRTAHLHELREETEAETLEKAVMEAVRVRQSRSGLPESFAATRHFIEQAREYLEAAAPFLTAPLRAKLQAQEARIKTLEVALRPFADLAGSSDGFCSPQSVGERSWRNNHQASYDEVAAECDVVKADKVLRGDP